MFFSGTPRRLWTIRRFSSPVPVVTGAFDQTPDLPEYGKAVSAVHFLPQHLNIPRCGAYQAQDHFQGGGLPRPIGAEKAVDAALGYIQIQMGHPQGISILLAQVVCLNDVHGKTSFLHSQR